MEPRPTRVLLVDDDASLCRVMAKAIARRGWTVAFATDRAAAEVEIARRPPDAIVLDLVLAPDVRGTDLLPVIRAHAPRAHVAIVTGHYDLEDAIAADALVDLYLAKPVGPRAMVALVERLLRKRSWRDGLLARCRNLGLSERQAELLGLLVAGETIKSAAAKMGCNESSARTYLQRALEYTGTGSRAELFALLLDGVDLPR